MNNAHHIPPVVSVVTAAWNSEHTIVRTIQSVLSQSNIHLEIIVVDDGSTDSTLQLLESIHDARLRVLHQENAGAASARNRGWKSAKGRYIMFLDSDDALVDGALERHLEAFQQEGADFIGFTYAQYQCVDPEGRQLKRSRLPSVKGRNLEFFLKEEGWLIPSVCMFHRRVLEHLGGFVPEMRYHEDREFGIRVAANYPAIPVPEITTLYTQSITGKARRSISNYEEALQNQYGILNECDTYLSEAQQTLLRNSLLNSLCSRFLLYGHLSSAQRLHREEPVTLKPMDLKTALTWISLKTRINFLGVAYRVIAFLRGSLLLHLH